MGNKSSLQKEVDQQRKEKYKKSKETRTNKCIQIIDSELEKIPDMRKCILNTRHGYYKIYCQNDRKNLPINKRIIEQHIKKKNKLLKLQDVKLITKTWLYFQINLVPS